jgi:hypothetical protein
MSFAKRRYYPEIITGNSDRELQCLTTFELANSGHNQGLEVPFVQAPMEPRWQDFGLGFRCKSFAELRIANS